MTFHVDLQDAHRVDAIRADIVQATALNRHRLIERAVPAIGEMLPELFCPADDELSLPVVGGGRDRHECHVRKMQATARGSQLRERRWRRLERDDAAVETRRARTRHGERADVRAHVEDRAAVPGRVRGKPELSRFEVVEQEMTRQVIGWVIHEPTEEGMAVRERSANGISDAAALLAKSPSPMPSGSHQTSQRASHRGTHNVFHMGSSATASKLSGIVNVEPSSLTIAAHRWVVLSTAHNSCSDDPAPRNPKGWNSTISRARPFPRIRWAPSSVSTS